VTSGTNGDRIMTSRKSFRIGGFAFVRSPWARIAFVVAVFAVLAGALLTRPLKRLTDFDQSFYLTIAYDLVHHGTFSNGIFDDVDSTRAKPKPGMFFAPLYPLTVAAVAALDSRFAATLDCTIEANEKHRPLASCDTYARPMFLVHAALLTIGVVAAAATGEIIFGGIAVFYLAAVLATLGVLWEADLFSHLMTESLSFCVQNLLGFAMVRALHSGRWPAWALAGVAAGIAATARPPYLLLVPLGLVFIAAVALWPRLKESGLTSPFPPPLWGRDREGGEPHAPSSQPTPLPNPPPQGGREQAECGAGKMLRLAAALPSAAAFVVAALLVLSPWLGRNVISLGQARFTEEYGAVTLVERFAFNDMTAREFVLAFPYCVPLVGPPLVRTLSGDDALDRFEWNKPNSFFAEGRARREELVVAHGRIDPIFPRLLREELARNWWRHILTTIPLAWCGLWVSGLFSVVLLPVFAVALPLAARRHPLMLFYAAPGFLLALLYAVLANHYPRYNLGLIGPIAVAAAWLTVDLMARRLYSRGFLARSL
jgi:hypothetical protein